MKICQQNDVKHTSSVQFSTWNTEWMGQRSKPHF